MKHILIILFLIIASCTNEKDCNAHYEHDEMCTSLANYFDAESFEYREINEQMTCHIVLKEKEREYRWGTLDFQKDQMVDLYYYIKLIKKVKGKKNENIR